LEQDTQAALLHIGSVCEVLDAFAAIAALLREALAVVDSAFLVEGFLEAFAARPVATTPHLAAGQSSDEPHRISPSAACAVGSLPSLVVETWEAFCAFKLIGRLRLYCKGSELARLNELAANADECRPRLRGFYNHMRKIYGHGILSTYADAVDLPDVDSSHSVEDILFSEAGGAVPKNTAKSQNSVAMPAGPSSIPVAIHSGSSATMPLVSRPLVFVDRSPVKNISQGLTVMLREPGNSSCCECGQSVGGGAWASINLGLIMCLRCSGAHRGLGVHISQVRSTSLDSWRPEWVQTCRAIGNRRGNAYWEANLPASETALTKPTANSSTAEVYRWCSLKYVKRCWAAEGMPPNELMQESLHTQLLLAQPQSEPKKTPPLGGCEAFDPFFTTTINEGCGDTGEKPVDHTVSATEASIVDPFAFGSPVRPTGDAASRQGDNWGVYTGSAASW
jgi:hypothetical protein